MLNNVARHVHMYTDTMNKPKYKAPVITCQETGDMPLISPSGALDTMWAGLDGGNNQNTDISGY